MKKNKIVLVMACIVCFPSIQSMDNQVVNVAQGAQQGFLGQLPLELLEIIFLKAMEGSSVQERLKIAALNRVNKQFKDALSISKMNVLLQAIKYQVCNIDPSSMAKFGMWMPKGSGSH